MMDPILEARMWMTMAIVVVGVFLPLIVFTTIQLFRPKTVFKWYHIVGYILWGGLWVSCGPNLIPEKYAVRSEKVYQCEWTYKTVPMYPLEVTK